MFRSVLIVVCLPLLFATLNAAEEPDEDFEPHELAKAGRVAASNGNIALMKALLEAGLPVDEPLYVDEKGEPGWTALHLCCVHNRPTMMKWLLKHGANRDIRDKDHQRPIDMAFESENKALCELLEIPDQKDQKDQMIDGIPRKLFGVLLREPVSHLKAPFFLSINGKDPGQDAQFALHVWGCKYLPASQVVEFEESGKRGYRHKETKEVGELVEIGLVPADKTDAPKTWTWSIRVRSGPFLAGGGSKGRVQKLYGYWMVTSEEGWDE